MPILPQSTHRAFGISDLAVIVPVIELVGANRGRSAWRATGAGV